MAEGRYPVPFNESCAQRSCSFGPVGILLDDLHHFDIASWQLLHALCDELRDSCLVIATLRENGGVLDAKAYVGDVDKEHIHTAATEILDELEALPRQQCVTLDRLTADEVREMMLRNLPSCQLHESNVRTILQTTDGNPVHVEQVLLCLDSRANIQDTLQQPNGLATSALDELAAPDMQQIITSRMDTLRPDAQLTLKVCSVLGHQVRLEVLTRVGLATARAQDAQQLRKQLLDDLQDLTAEAFLERVRGQSSTWVWQSHVARDIVYAIPGRGMVRAFHASTAAALESLEAVSHGLPMSHVAWHWTMSCDMRDIDATLVHNAIRCWRLAAADVADRGAYLDAVRFMSKTLDLSEQLLMHEMRQNTQRSAMSAHAASAQPSITITDMARQHKFRADMYFKLLLDPDRVRAYFAS
jgi:predicted ATPase